ncbi:MAG: glycosyltransferase family 4 protein [Minisyncoccota bacterium]
MKILIATGIFPPDIGGPATYSKLLADKLPARGFEVVVANFGEVRSLPKIVRHIAYFLKVLWRARECDAVYAQDPVSVGLPAMLATKILRKKFYLKIVGDYAWEQGVQRAGVTDDLDTFSREYAKYSSFVRFLKRIECHVALSADTIITPSKYLKGIIENWGVPAEKITVIYNGFNAPVLHEDKATLRKKLGMDGYAILSVGRLVPWKGFEMLIESISALAKEISGARLFIVGSGPDEATLKKKVVDLGLEDRVTFLGTLSREKLFEYIKASDVFVLNTSYEGFSHQLLEVMALGTPIITTPAGGNVEVIKNHKSGILVPYNDRALFEKAIKELRADVKLADTLAVHAQEKVKEFSNERMLDEIARVLAQA